MSARGAQAPAKPSFASNRELARWVDEANLGKGGRVSSAAFLPAEGETYLSVNSPEIESLEQIAEFYKNQFLGGRGPVYVSCLKVMDYTAASKDAGITMRYDKTVSSWQFEIDGTFEEAYRGRPNQLSRSHCGVETIRSMRSDAANRFARRLAGKPPRRNPHAF